MCPGARTRRSPVRGGRGPSPGTVCTRDRGRAAWCLAVVRIERSRWWSRASSEVRRAKSPAMVGGPAGALKRSAPPARLAWAALGLPIAGQGYGLCVLCPWAKSAARVRIRGVRRRRRLRGARLWAGSTEAWGSLPPRSSAALLGESLWAFCAFPPCMACLARAWPRTQGHALWGTPVGEPVPGAAPRDGLVVAVPIRGHGLAKRCGSRWHVAVEPECAILTQEAAIRGAGMPVEAPGQGGLRGGEAPCGLLRLRE
jgi:hypothetical protein